MISDNLLALIGILLVAFACVVVGRTRKSESDTTILYWIAAVVVSVALVFWLTRETPSRRWQWTLAALPSIILLSHGAFLYYVRSKVVPRATTQNVTRVKKMIPKDSDAENDDESYRHLLEAGERYFSAQALLLRYGVPAMLILGIGLALSNVVMHYAAHHYFYAFGCKAPLVDTCRLLGELVGKEAQPSVPLASVAFLPAASAVGAAYGLVGAYTYVLLFLGKRSFRLDITPGAANWCTITMAVGPVLAGFLGPFVLDGQAPRAGTDGFMYIALLFLAGFAPRFVVERLEEAGRRVFANPSRDALPSRTLPLTAVQGVSRDTQDRLAEEGIDDVSQLAMADPYRLLRNTAYDKRQIVSWMDRALLMLHLPEGYSALERRGVTGAMALAWYAEEDKDGAKQEAFKVLATEARIDEKILRAVGKHLAADRQLRLLRILYVLDDGENEAKIEQDKPPSSVPIP